MKELLLRELGRLVYAQQDQKDIFSYDLEESKRMYHEYVRAFHKVIEYMDHYQEQVKDVGC